MQAMGCMVAFAGMVLLTVTPALGHYVELGSGSAYTVLAVAVVLLGLGAVLGLVAAGRGH